MNLNLSLTLLDVKLVLHVFATSTGHFITVFKNFPSQESISLKINSSCFLGLDHVQPHERNFIDGS